MDFQKKHGSKNWNLFLTDHQLLMTVFQTKSQLNTKKLLKGATFLCKIEKNRRMVAQER